MKKVYLLLRNNDEKGPFTFDELLLQDLQPSDLIWVEGESMAWCSPSELEELKKDIITSSKKNNNVVTPSFSPSASSSLKTNISRVDEQKEPAGRNIFSTTPPPVYDLEKRAEELRERVLASNPRTKNFRPVNIQPVRAVERDDSSTVYTSKENFDFIYRTRTKKKYVSGAHLMVVTIASILVAGILYGNWSFINPNKGNISVASTIYTSEDEHAAIAAANDQPKEVILPAENIVLPVEPATADYSTAMVKQVKNIEPVETKTNTVIKEETETKIPEPKPIKKEVKLTPATIEEVPEKEIKKEPIVAKKETPAPIKDEEEIEEKKGIGKFIKKIFGKKNKNEE